MEDEVRESHQPALVDLLRDWLFANKIENNVRNYFGDYEGVGVTGFGWAIIVNNLELTVANRLSNEVLVLSAADPDALEKIKAKISEVEANAINYLIDHVDDDGWKDWKPPQESI